MSIAPEQIYFLSDELQKVAFLSYVTNFGKDVAHAAADPLHHLATNPVGAVRAGWDALSNTSAAATAARRASAAAGLRQGHAYTSALGSGLLDKARAAGWLSNTAKYIGGDTLRGAGNTLMRALPGRKTLLVASAAHGALRDSGTKVDTEGRQIGLGERLGATGAGLATHFTLAGAHAPGGLIPGMIGRHIVGRLGSAAGRYVGRSADTAAARLQALKAARAEQ